MPSRLLAGCALAALSLTLAPAAADARGASPKGPYFTIAGDVSRKSVIRSRCPIPSALRAFSIETTTTTYTYSFSGGSPKGRELGGITSRGETTYELVREVEGESEYVKPTRMGPTRRPVGGSESGFSSAVRRVREGRRTMLGIDFGPLAGGLRHTMTVPVPAKGTSKSHKLRVPEVTRRDPRVAPGCTHSETITVTGDVTVGQRR